MTKVNNQLQEVLSNLNREIDGIKDRTVGGLLAAGLILQAEAQRRAPYELGNLSGSADTRKSPSNPLVVEVVFTASYAAAVHENVEEKWKGKPRQSGLGKYWGPRGRSKYLESAIPDKSAEMLAAVRDRVRVPQ